MKDKMIHLAGAHKKLLIVLAAGLVLGTVVLTTVLLYWNQNKNSAGESSYRSYTAQKGNVTVGTSESGTVMLDQTAVSFPVNVTVSKTLVKAGYSVKKGDVLVQLDQSSISSGTSETRNKLAAAQLALEQALTDQNSKLKAAQLTYQSSLQKAAFATTQEALTKEEVQEGIGSARKALDNAEAQLAKYQSLQSGFSADYNKLNELKKWRDDAKTQETSFETQLTNYKDQYNKQLNALSSLESSMNSKYAAWVAAENGAGDDDADTAKDAYDAAKSAYNAYADNISSVVQGQKDLESKAALYTAEYNNYSTAYDSFNNTFTEKYGSTATADTLADKVSTLQGTVQDAQYALEKAQKSESNSLNEAEQTKQGSLNEGSSAGSTYDLAAHQLAEAVTTQQTTYDSLKSQLDSVESAINGNGTITAPCDGIVAAVNTTDGSSVKADEAIVTISKTSSVNMAVSLSEDDIADVAIGQPAEITLSAYDGQTFDAAVESIATSPARSSSASVSYTVTVKMTGENTMHVFTGMSGEVTLIRKQKKDVLYVPDQTIAFDNGVSSVLVKKQDGTQQKTTVTTGFSNGRYVEILSGLQEGDTVLAESAVVK